MQHFNFLFYILKTFYVYVNKEYKICRNFLFLYNERVRKIDISDCDTPLT